MGSEEQRFDTGEQHPLGALNRMYHEATYPPLSGEDAAGLFQVSLPLYLHGAPEEEIAVLFEKTWDAFMEADFNELVAVKAYLVEQQQAFQTKVDFVAEALVRDGYISDTWVLTSLAADYAQHYGKPDDGSFNEGFEKEMTEVGIPNEFFRYVKQAGVHTRHLQLFQFRLSMLRRVMWHRGVLGERSTWDALAGTEREELTQEATARVSIDARCWAGS